MTTASPPDPDDRNDRGSHDPSSGAPRRFARLAEGRSVADGYQPLPPDGLCLSSFLLLSRGGRKGEVLVGHLDPKAPWAEIGALDPRRVEQNASGWMLPSCHLLYFESPEQAAHRIAKEQLGLRNLSLEPPLVFSEAYAPRRHPQRGSHWDLQFLFRGTVPEGWEARHPAWRELRFVDPASTPRAEFTRSHDEVLELVGFTLA